MGKKGKRSRNAGAGGPPPSGVVSDESSASSAASAPPTSDAAAPARKPPALRTTAEETAEDLRCEDPYGDVLEDDGDDDSYEEVYESSGDEDEEYLEAMAEGDGERAAGLASSRMDTDEGDEGVGGGAAKLPAIPAGHGECPPSQVKTWNPFEGHSPDVDLEMDESAYRMHHAVRPEWPSLTLDVLPDRHLGDHRTRFPHTVTLVVGSQADEPKRNKITVMRMSDLCRSAGAGKDKTENELDDEMLGEEWNAGDDKSEGGESDESESEDEETDLDPVLESYSFPHASGGINRLRVCPQNTDVVAAWSDAGEVSLYDIGGAVDTLDRSSTRGKSDAAPRRMRKEPFFVYSGHETEGYALDWSRVKAGRLATADCAGGIHVWDATHPVDRSEVSAKYKRNSPWSNSSFSVAPTYSAHGVNIDSPSVEDLQWSPTEETVLASAECGGVVRVYDVRCPGRAMITNKILESGADVNVISWNRLVGNLLASGGDDGEFSS